MNLWKHRIWIGVLDGVYLGNDKEYVHIVIYLVLLLAFLLFD